MTKANFRKKILIIAESTSKESKMIDFKAELDVANNGDWCEFIKDVIAIANSGGGALLVGVNDDGTKSNYNHQKFLSFDNAKIADKISSYLDIDYTDFEVLEIKRGRKRVACMICYPSFPPRIFAKPGDYLNLQGKQKSAFQKGVLYTRRGSRSIPAKSSDLLIILNKELENRKKGWLGNIRKVVESPHDYEVHTVKKGTNVYFSEQQGVPIRITDNPDAPEFKISNPDKICPYNTTRTVELINDKLNERWVISNYDLLLLRYLFEIEKNPEFYYHPSHGASQYGDKLIDWVIGKFNENNNFFAENRAEWKNRKGRL